MTKYRYKVLAGEVAERVRERVRGTCEAFEIRIVKGVVSRDPVGSEFLNHHLLRYFSTHPAKPAFTRSLPCEKNYNTHVEQRNWTHVRQLFGYERFDNFPNVVLILVKAKLS